MDLKKLSDQELVEKIQVHDERAFEVLHQRYYKQMFFFLHHKTADEDLSRDVLQDVFIKFWNMRESLNHEKSIKSLLFTMSNHMLVDHLRKKKSWQVPLDEVSEPSNPEPDSDQELKEQMVAVIHAQPDQIKTVFLLSKYEGYMNKEIAEMLGISIKTVEARITTMLKVLRKTLGEPKNTS